MGLGFRVYRFRVWGLGASYWERMEKNMEATIMGLGFRVSKEWKTNWKRSFLANQLNLGQVAELREKGVHFGTSLGGV